MPWKVNPFSGTLSYYEKGVPPGGGPGQVLKKETSEEGDYSWQPETTTAQAFKSQPPEGMLPVKNLYVDPRDEKVVIEYDDVPGGEGFPSETPPGKCQVTNLFVDPVSGKLNVEYDETPV